MNMTELWIIQRFGGAEIPVVEMAAVYFNLDSKQAQQWAREDRFPFPTFRAGTQKSPWMCRALDLANYLDQCYRKAAAEHEKINDTTFGRRRLA